MFLVFERTRPDENAPARASRAGATLRLERLLLERAEPAAGSDGDPLSRKPYFHDCNSWLQSSLCAHLFHAREGTLRISSLSIDSSRAVTELCRLGGEFGTDKSPFNDGMHRHAYTAVYDLLFATRRHEALVIGEIGILDNMSMHMWRDYFPSATLYGFEFSEEKIAKAKADNLPLTNYGQADVSDKMSLVKAFGASERMYDILIDDSTHLFDHQINFVEVGLDFVKPGGFLIVEDLFRPWPNERYEQAIEHLAPYFSTMTFIEAQHDQSFSGGSLEPYFDNDKLLVMVRNGKRRPIASPARKRDLQRL